MLLLMFRREQLKNLTNVLTTKTEISLTTVVSSNESKHCRELLQSNTLEVRFSSKETKIRNGYDMRVCRRCYTTRISGHLGYLVGATPRAR